MSNTHTQSTNAHTHSLKVSVFVHECTHRVRINLFSTDRRSILRTNLHAHGFRISCMLVRHQKYRVYIYIVSDGQTAVFMHKLAIDAYALRLSSLRLTQTLSAQTHDCIYARTDITTQVSDSRLYSIINI